MDVLIALIVVAFILAVFKIFSKGKCQQCDKFVFAWQSCYYTATKHDGHTIKNFYHTYHIPAI